MARACYIDLVCHWLCRHTVSVFTTIAIVIAATLSGCDEITHTDIKVSANAKDNQDSEQIDNHIISAVQETTTQFRFSKYNDDNARLYTSERDISGRESVIWVEVFPDGHLDEVDIYEMHVSRASELHRAFAEALVVALRARGLDVKMFYQPQDSSGWMCLLICIFLLVVAVFLGKEAQAPQGEWRVKYITALPFSETGTSLALHSPAPETMRVPVGLSTHPRWSQHPIINKPSSISRAA